MYSTGAKKNQYPPKTSTSLRGDESASTTSRYLDSRELDCVAVCSTGWLVVRTEVQTESRAEAQRVEPKSQQYEPEFAKIVDERQPRKKVPKRQWAPRNESRRKTRVNGTAINRYQTIEGPLESAERDG